MKPIYLRIYRSLRGGVGKFTSLFLALLLVFIPLVVLITSFVTTPSKVFASHSRVNLLTADGFAVLAGTAITGTNTNVVNGDVGLDPGGGASITLLTCAEMASGTIYDNNGGYAGGGGGSTACRVTNAGLLTTAKNDLTTAYNDAAGRSTTSTVGTNLGGSTLTDGTYDSASGTFEITGGQILTLNGQGNANAVFIFKMATTLVTGSSSRVELTNGAQACNVFWQVGSAATLGTSTTFVGTIMANTEAITDNGGSNVNGRLLARTAAVTLNNTTLTRSTCAAGTAGGPAIVSSTSTSSSSCPTLNNIVAPSIIESRRIDADSIFISWGPFSGTDKFVVQYGLENGKWLHSVNVTGFSTTLNALPNNQPIWVRVAARNDCYIGTFGPSKLVGGPLLPNVGVGPKSNYMPWYIPIGSIVAISVLLVLIKRKHKFS